MFRLKLCNVEMLSLQAYLCLENNGCWIITQKRACARKDGTNMFTTENQNRDLDKTWVATRLTSPFSNVRIPFGLIYFGWAMPSSSSSPLIAKLRIKGYTILNSGPKTSFRSLRRISIVGFIFNSSIIFSAAFDSPVAGKTIRDHYKTLPTESYTK